MNTLLYSYSRLSFSREFNNACQSNFRTWNKMSFYAWCYGSHKHDLVWKDHRKMYLMGGEL